MPYRYGSGWRETGFEESIVFLKKKTAITDPLALRYGGLLHITIPSPFGKGDCYMKGCFSNVRFVRVLQDAKEKRLRGKS